ncbi:hypothetical protein BDN71DRAFT_1592830 [Pleurotus eryngii]|uniref:Uncharacterized protein n=1 Tax=Pleurotus eryngii TaxID=5323 RepID=A0A9P5ZMZ8_PLEER|nr:hypothetical protein BDN71DRAFT_1592830 [Pleurotus eryngii]
MPKTASDDKKLPKEIEDGLEWLASQLKEATAGSQATKALEDSNAQDRMVIDSLCTIAAGDDARIRRPSRNTTARKSVNSQLGESSTTNKD